MLKELSILSLLPVFFLGCSRKQVALFSPKSEIETYSVINEPTEFPKREFRGAWVATIANIDWPSAKGLSTDIQKEEYVKIVNHHRDMGLNALLVQVRAASDAFYAKSKEPWSEWLMGEQGKAPSPIYDPMEFMIAETHKNGLEFHAWLNLNRGKHRLASSVIEDHLIYKKPEWFLSYGDYELYNFGLPEVRNYIIDIVLNIVREYDIDGIHFDDYFYPYKVNGLELDDKGTFEANANGFSNIEDWRRNNIDLIIKGISDQIKKEKSWVSFGISPFGVWRNKSDDELGSETQGGQPSYDFLYADTRKWAQEGWIDYIAPQIYFPFEHKLVPYGILTDWWTNNHGMADLYIGHGVYRVDKSSSLKPWTDPNQISRQIDYNRFSKHIGGSIFYNTNTLVNNNLGVRDSVELRYRYPALNPVKKNVSDVQIAPRVNNLKGLKNEKGLLLTWDVQQQEKNQFLIYRFEKGEVLNIGNPKKIIARTSERKFLDKGNLPNSTYIYVVTSIDKWRNESKPSILNQ